MPATGGTMAAEVRARRVRLHALVTLANDVVAQALGTVLAGGLLYLGAAALGMVATTSVRSVIVVAVLCGTPLVAGVALIHGVHDWRRSRSGSRCACPACSDPESLADTL